MTPETTLACCIRPSMFIVMRGKTFANIKKTTFAKFRARQRSIPFGLFSNNTAPQRVQQAF